MIPRPRTLSEMWAWALREHEASARAVPTQLHTRHYPPDDDPGDIPVRDVIGGLPFSRAFERYMESVTSNTPCLRALRKMRSRGAAQSLEFHIAFAAVVGGHDIEMARILLRCSWPVFRDAAARGLDVLWNLTDMEIKTPMEAA